MALGSSYNLPKKKKNKQTNMLSTWVVSILVQNFIPYFQSNFLLILERLSFDGLRKEKKTSPTIFLSPSPSQLNTPPTKGKRRGYLNFPKAPLPSIIKLKF